jgi:hypothetical protein
VVAHHGRAPRQAPEQVPHQAGRRPDGGIAVHEVAPEQQGAVRPLGPPVQAGEQALQLVAQAVQVAHGDDGMGQHAGKHRHRPNASGRHSPGLANANDTGEDRNRAGRREPAAAERGLAAQ